jgi:hypothetical protein
MGFERVSGLSCVLVFYACAGGVPDEVLQLREGRPHSPSVAQPLSTDHSTAGPAEKRIGDGCSSSDGWQSNEAAGEFEPPIGVPFCDSLGIYGYFTASCTVDADCPDDAKCDCGVGATCTIQNPAQCRRPCIDDSECVAPHTCGGSPAVSYCKCGAGCMPGVGVPLAPQ